MENLYNIGTLQLNHRSCEMMAEDLYVEIAAKYPGRNVRIDVSEDAENGAHLEFIINPH
jgi:hypothetical protein